MRINELDIFKEADTVYHTDFGTLVIFKNFLVAELKEGVLMDEANYLGMSEILKAHYGHLESFGYISNRIFSYALMPTVLEQARSIINADIQIAIVNYSELSKRSAEYEKNFFPYNTELFENLDNALNWIQESFPNYN